MRQRKSPDGKTKRKRKPKKAESLVPEPHEAEQGDESNGNAEDDDNGRKGFYACYLLSSLSPRSKNYTYIGFTVNPRRRIRQHNGEIRSGAFSTKGKRPLAMVFCIYGFPTNVSALQFEWAWQHPRESKAVREAAMSFKSFSGVANRIKLAYTMLGLPPWQRLNLTVNYFSTKYENCSPGLPSLPQHMKVQVCPMDDLPCYTGTSEDSLLDNGEDGGQYGFGDDDDCENVEENVVQGEDANEQSSSGGEEQCKNGGDDKASDNTSDSSGNREESSRYDAVAHIALDYAGGFDIGAEQNWGWYDEEPDWRHTSYSPNPEVDRHIQTFNFNSSPGRRIASVLGEIGDGNVLVMDDGSASKLKRKELSTNGAAAGEDAAALCSSGHNIEVIDLLSPSPVCTMWPVSKRSRFSGAVCPEIIDLT